MSDNSKEHKQQAVSQYIDIPPNGDGSFTITFSNIKEICGFVSYTDNRGPWCRVNSFSFSGNKLYISLHNPNTKYASKCTGTFTVNGI